MISTLQSNFKGRDKIVTPFKPSKQNEPKSVELFLNSQDKIQGTNDNATFKLNLAPEFQSDKLHITLKNFIPTYPTGTDEGIVSINMIGLENPHSFSSSNMTTHRTLATMWLNEGQPKEYPPVAIPSSNNSPTLSNQPYGNGQYTLSQSSAYSLGSLWRAFVRDNGTLFAGTGFGAQNVYNTNSGLYVTGSNFTNVGGSNYFGEWLQIQLPQSIYATSFKLHPSGTDFLNRNMNTGHLVGSSNGTSWAHLCSLSNVFWVDNTPQTFTITNPATPFNYYRLIATRVGNSNITEYRDAFFIGEWWLYGNVNPQVPTTTIRQYPPAALSSSVTTMSNQAYGNGIYTTSESSTVLGSSGAWSIFDANEADGWTCSNLKYDRNTNGNYLGSDVTVASGSNFSGEWFQIECPKPFVLTHYTITGNNLTGRNPRDFIVAGSTNGTSWTKLAEWYDQSLLVGNTLYPFNITNPNEFRFYRFIVPQIQGPLGSQSGSTWLSINSMKLFGYELTETNRTGQVNLNSSVVTMDKTLFSRPFTIQLTSPTGTNLTNMGTWSCELEIIDDAEK
jgi:hypothetical protein